MGLGSILGKIGKGVLNVATGGISGSLADILGAGGAAAGSMANAAASNRDAQYSGQMDLAQILAQRDIELQRLRAQSDNDFTSNQIARETSGAATRGDAWRKLLSAQHTANPSALPMVSKYQAPQRMPSDAEKQGADALSSEVLARLQGGNPIAPVEKRTPGFDYDPMSTIDPRLLKPGTGEKIGGILAPILTGVSGVGRGTGGFAGGYGGGIKHPTLTPADLAWLRTQNPGLVA